MATHIVNAETLGLLVIACLAVNLSPGPSVLLVTSVSAARGFRAGLFAVFGMTAGAFVHVILAASGVAALLATSALVFAIIQYLGGGLPDLPRHRFVAQQTSDH